VYVLPLPGIHPSQVLLIDFPSCLNIIILFVFRIIIIIIPRTHGGQTSDTLLSGSVGKTIYGTSTSESTKCTHPFPRIFSLSSSSLRAGKYRRYYTSRVRFTFYPRITERPPATCIIMRACAVVIQRVGIIYRAREPFESSLFSGAGVYVTVQCVCLFSV